jgi:hypothetical protein
MIEKHWARPFNKARGETHVKLVEEHIFTSLKYTQDTFLTIIADAEMICYSRLQT